MRSALRGLPPYLLATIVGKLRDRRDKRRDPPVPPQMSDIDKDYGE